METGGRVGREDLGEQRTRRWHELQLLRPAYGGGGEGKGKGKRRERNEAENNRSRRKEEEEEERDGGVRERERARQERRWLDEREGERERGLVWSGLVPLLGFGQVMTEQLYRLLVQVSKVQ